METKALNRTNDALFKWIFGNAKQKTILLEFINAVLTEGDEENIIADIELIDRENDAQSQEDKVTRLDILAKTNDGKRINIEVQTTNKKNLKERSLYYWAQIFIRQLKRGEHYRDLQSTISINVVTFDIWPENEYYHNDFRLKEKDRHYELTDKLSIQFLELHKWKKLSRKAQNRLERWLLYLSNSNPKELEEVARMDMAIKEALEAEKAFMRDEALMHAYMQIEKTRLDYDSDIVNARDEGRLEGRLEGKLETARSMLMKGFSSEIVQECTGLTAEEIKQVIDKTN